MPLLALTRANVDFVKRALRSAYSAVGSSHLSEALAAACGHRTAIALATALRSAAPARPDLVRIDEDAFTARLGELGHRDVARGALAGLVRSDHLPDRIWTTVKGRDLTALNVWFRECQRRDIPYVYITLRRKYAEVDWDCITVNPDRDEVTLGAGSRELVDKLFATFRSLASANSKKSMFEGSAFVGSIEKLSPEDALELADAVFEILYGAIREGAHVRRRQAECPARPRVTAPHLPPSGCGNSCWQ